jgi:hypothetical protein
MSPSLHGKSGTRHTEFNRNLNWNAGTGFNAGIKLLTGLACTNAHYELSSSTNNN